jgi:phosphate transport system permease protein
MKKRDIMTAPGAGGEPVRPVGRPSAGDPRDPAVAPTEGSSLTGERPGGDVHNPALVIGSEQPLGISTLSDEPPVSGAGSKSLGTPSSKIRLGDRVLSAMATGAGLFTIALIALIALFLLKEAIPSIGKDKANFLFSRDWVVSGSDLRFGIVDLLWTTVLISLLAMLIAMPIAVGIALFITQYAPARLARPVAYLVDLLAAIPSIIYGVWGIIVLAPHLSPVQKALYHLDFIPIFANKGAATGTVFDGGVVLAIMILPIITAVSRDVFERTPRSDIEAAWALGATRWEMIRLAVIPYGRPGVVSGAMLGLGRALGETIAITLILYVPGEGNPFNSSIFYGGATFASKIANASSEFNNPTQTGAYIAGGLVLFVLTFAVNAAARAVVNKGRAS